MVQPEAHSFRARSTAPLTQTHSQTRLRKRLELLVVRTTTSGATLHQKLPYAMCVCTTATARRTVHVLESRGARSLSTLLVMFQAGTIAINLMKLTAPT